MRKKRFFSNFFTFIFWLFTPWELRPIGGNQGLNVWLFPPRSSAGETMQQCSCAVVTYSNIPVLRKQWGTNGKRWDLLNEKAPLSSGVEGRDYTGDIYVPDWCSITIFRGGVENWHSSISHPVAEMVGSHPPCLTLYIVCERNDI